nr:MAG TPA: hypothetical protein [Caudoviricetes sp.]
MYRSFTGCSRQLEGFCYSCVSTARATSTYLTNFN